MSAPLAEYIAKMLTDLAGRLPPPQFKRLLDRLLSDSSPGDVALIAEHLPVTVLPLLPKRFMH